MVESEKLYWPLFGGSQALVFLSLVLRPSQYRRLLFIPVLGTTIYLVFFGTTGALPVDYQMANGIFTSLFIASDYILLTDVQHELRMKKQVDPASILSFTGRVKWAFKLFLTPRGIDWNHETALRPRLAPKSRVQFVRSQILWIVCYLLAFDLASLQKEQIPSFYANGPSLAECEWLWRSFNVYVWIALPYTFLNAQYRVLSVIAVISGLSTPEDWPPLFGSLIEGYTVRNIWSRVWHRLLRRSELTHSRFLAYKILRLRPGTKAAFFVILYTTFFIAGIIHYAADYAMLRHWRGGGLRFFLLQAVAISVESAVLNLWKGRKQPRMNDKLTKANPNIWWRLLGYMWVGAWLAYSMPVWLDPLLKAGMMEVGRKHYSLLLKLTRGQWSQAKGT